MPIRRLLRCFFFIITLYFYCVHIGTTVVMLYGRCKQHWAQERHLPISYTFLFISTASSFCYLFFDFFYFFLCSFQVVLFRFQFVWFVVHFADCPTFVFYVIERVVCVLSGEHLNIVCNSFVLFLFNSNQKGQTQMQNELRRNNFYNCTLYIVQMDRKLGWILRFPCCTSWKHHLVRAHCSFDAN